MDVHSGIFLPAFLKIAFFLGRFYFGSFFSVVRGGSSFEVDLTRTLDLYPGNTQCVKISVIYPKIPSTNPFHGKALSPLRMKILAIEQVFPPKNSIFLPSL